MTLFKSFLSIYFLFILTGLSACRETPNPSTDTEVLYFNGNIYTVNAAQPWATAMIVKNGIITYIGDDDTAEQTVAEGATSINLKGKFVMPGIHDVHQHPMEASSSNYQFTIDDNETDPENYMADIAAAHQSNAGTGWLLGWGHFIETVLAATRNPKEIIDDVSTDRPIAIMEQTSHSIWCNSKALELMGIDDNTPNPKGGVIMRDANGEATGVLIDNAGNLLTELALVPSAAKEQNDYDGLKDYGLPLLAENGITSICEGRTFWKQNQHVVWQRLANDDELTVRVNLGLWAYPEADDATQIADIKALYDNTAGNLLRINQIKLYSDGIVTNTTSAMHDDFLVDYFGLPTNNGVNYFTEQRLAQYITALEGTGFDFHIHAIGDRGVHESLNAIEQSGTAQGRHRITHVEYVNSTDYSRFAQLNVTADAQVVGDFTQPSHWNDHDHIVNSALNTNLIPIKSLVDANARLTLSSDWDVSALNPFVGIQNAVTRSPQNITLEEAIAAYTINAAYVMRQENLVGSLEEGKEADFIVLDRNPFDIDASTIDKTKVLETYLKGNKIY